MYHWCCWAGIDRQMKQSVVHTLLEKNKYPFEEPFLVPGRTLCFQEEPF